MSFRFLSPPIDSIYGFRKQGFPPGRGGSWPRRNSGDSPGDGKTHSRRRNYVLGHLICYGFRPMVEIRPIDGLFYGIRVAEFEHRVFRGYILLLGASTGKLMELQMF